MCRSKELILVQFSLLALLLLAIPRVYVFCVRFELLRFVYELSYAVAIDQHWHNLVSIKHVRSKALSVKQLSYVAFLS